MKKIILFLIISLSLEASFDKDRINPFKVTMKYAREMRSGMIATRQTMHHHFRQVSNHWKSTIAEDFSKTKYYSKEMEKQFKYGGNYNMVGYEYAYSPAIKEPHPYRKVDKVVK